MAGSGGELTAARVALALGVILVLAILVPYAAVRRLHEHRLTRADAQARSLAAAVGPLMARPDVVAAGRVIVLSGGGLQPKALDERWTAAAAPLATETHGPAAAPDPWGNAFLVVTSARGSGGGAWILSAGPDGVIETPFPAATLTPAGDDRIAPIR